MNQLNKYRAFFEVTEMTVIHETYMDNEYWIDMECANLDEAGTEALLTFIQTFYNQQDRIPVATKIRLLRITAHHSNATRSFIPPGETPPFDDVRRCRVCGCTDKDCRQCIKRTGSPCHWIEIELCSACEAGAKALDKFFKASAQNWIAKVRALNELLKLDYSVEQIAKMTKISVKEIKKLLQL